MFKKHLEEIEAIGAERGVSGIPIAWVPSNIAAPDSADSQAVAAQTAYRELVKNIRRDSQEGIVFPLMYNDKGDKMFDLTLLTTQGSETGKIGEMIERKSREMLQVCLAEFIMLGAGKTGSFALSQTKVDLFLQAIGSYLDLIEEVFNTHAVPRLFELNPQFSVEDLPKIRHEDIKDMDLKNMSDYVSKLITAGAVQPDDILSDYLRTAAGLPSAENEFGIQEAQDQIGQAMPQEPAATAAEVEGSKLEEKQPAGVQGKDEKETEKE
jgi:phage gp29-like protein